MADVLKTIEDDLKEAMKAKDTKTLGVLRMIKSALKNKSIELKRDVNESEFIAILSTLVKQRRESIEQYQNGGRDDLAENEQQEIEVIQRYLPQPLTDDELSKLITDAVANTGAAGPGDMGKVMGALKAGTQGRVDGKVLATKVREALN